MVDGKCREMDADGDLHEVNDENEEESYYSNVRFAQSVESGNPKSLTCTSSLTGYIRKLKIILRILHDHDDVHKFDCKARKMQRPDKLKGNFLDPVNSSQPTY